MWTRIGKQISAKAANRIRKIQKKMEFLTDIDDNGFLLKDIFPGDMYWADQHEYLCLLINRNIGPIINQKYELNSFPENKLFYLARTNPTEVKAMDFEISTNRDPFHMEESKIYIGLRDRENNLVPFTLNPQGPGYHKNILTLATYFYNKYPTYLKIKATLLEKEAKLAKRLGALYASDIIALFSAEKVKQQEENFLIPAENMTKAIYYEDTIPVLGEDVTKAKIHFFSGPIIDSLCISLSLTAENIIYFDIASLGPKALEKTNCEAFINNQTNNWLKELEEMTEFGLAIYEQVKTKIVLDKLI